MSIRRIKLTSEKDPKKARPYLEIGAISLTGEFSMDDIKSAIQNEQRSLSMTGKTYGKSVPAYTASVAERITFWFSNNYLHILNFVFFLYILIPMAAPVLLKANIVLPARIIYKIYSPLCHQLGFRSFYLFGEQYYYPRALADIPDTITYEEVTGNDATNLILARDFLGNETYGFKIAICERCLAIYGAMLLFGFLYQITGRKIKPIPWYLWILFGVIPMGLDGASQLPSLLSSLLPAWLPIRESTPILRILTGSIFGFTTVWYLYPYIEESMQETREMQTRMIVLKREVKTEVD